jgi:predicted nucleic acid-binding protein
MSHWMPNNYLHHEPILLDTCVLINLLATTADIIPQLSAQVFIAAAVQREHLYLRDEDGQPIRQELPAVLQQCAPEGGDEHEAYVSYARFLDDGEAMSLAIAATRQITLATDERKVERLVAEEGLKVRLLSTGAIMHAWAQQQEVDRVRQALMSIAQRARFRPPAHCPHRNWWEELTNAKE